MRHIWIKSAIVFFMGAMTMPVIAQENTQELKDFREIPSPEKNAQRRAGEMKKALNLTDKQYNKIYKLYYKSEKKLSQSSSSNNRMGSRMGMGGPGGGMGGNMSAPSQDGSNGKRPAMDETAMKEQMEKIEKQKTAAQEKINKKMKKILSEDQYSSWQEMEQKRQDMEKQGMKRRDNRPGNRPTPPDRNMNGENGENGPGMPPPPSNADEKEKETPSENETL